MEIKNITQAKFHIKHCIEQNEGIQLSDKSVYDIVATMTGIINKETTGAISNMQSAQVRNLILTKKIQELEEFIVKNVHIGEN